MCCVTLYYNATSNQCQREVWNKVLGHPVLAQYQNMYSGDSVLSTLSFYHLSYIYPRVCVYRFLG